MHHEAPIAGRIRSTGENVRSGHPARPFLHFLGAAAALAITFSISAAPRLHSTGPPTLSQEDLLWWLPSDTESVVAARGPFPLPAISKKDQEEEPTDGPASLAGIRRALEDLPLETFYAFELANSLQGTPVAFAMQGSRHFREPLPGFDVMDFDGCSIIVFQSSLGERGDMLAGSLRKKATRVETVGGTKLLVFHRKDGEAEWDFSFALPRPDVLLVANNLSYIHEVLERMEQRKATRALPESLPEWRFLDPAARFWGLRHYDRSQAKTDATSPFSADRTFGPGDDKAIGYLFALDPANPRTALIFYLTGDEAKVRESAAKKTVVNEPEAGVKYEGRLSSPAPGILESTYTLDRRITLDYVLLTVQIALGRGAYF